MIDNAVDLIYIVGSGSRWDNNELRYSLRSLEKYATNVGKVYVTGIKPDFLSDEVIHTPCNDDYPFSVININEKILHTLRTHNISENFVYMNDDFFLIKEVDISSYPYYYKRMLKHDDRKSDYVKSLVYTYYYLVFQEKNYKDFELHLPIVFNKEKYLSLNEHWELCKKLPYGLQLRSIYCNMFDIEGVKTNDLKITAFESLDEIKKKIEPRNCFSIGNNAIPSGMDRYLNELFPEKSKYEK